MLEIKRPLFHAIAYFKRKTGDSIEEFTDCYIVFDVISFHAWLTLFLQDYVMKSVVLLDEKEQGKINEMLKNTVSWKTTEYFGDIVYDKWQKEGAQIPCDNVMSSTWTLDDGSILEIQLKTETLDMIQKNVCGCVLDKMFLEMKGKTQ